MSGLLAVQACEAVRPRGNRAIRGTHAAVDCNLDWFARQTLHIANKNRKNVSHHFFSGERVAELDARSINRSNPAVRVPVCAQEIVLQRMRHTHHAVLLLSTSTRR